MRKNAQLGVMHPTLGLTFTYLSCLEAARSVEAIKITNCKKLPKMFKNWLKYAQNPKFLVIFNTRIGQFLPKNLKIARKYVFMFGIVWNCL